MIDENSKVIKSTKELNQMYDENILTAVYKWVPLHYAENLEAKIQTIETDLKVARALSDGKDSALLQLAQSIQAFGKWLEQSRGDFMDDSGEAALMTIICEFQERLSPTKAPFNNNNESVSKIEV